MKYSTLLLQALLAFSVCAAPGQQPSGHPGPTSADGLNSTYIIGPADVLEVTVWKEPSLSASLPVRPDGKISIALLGDLPAADLTPLQLAENIAAGLRKFIQDPSVYVVVKAINSQRVYLLGEVQHVGPIFLSAEMTPLQAIASAGGLTPYANEKHIYILRSESNKQVKIPFDYKRAVRGSSAQAVLLRSGDTIVVP